MIPEALSPDTPGSLYGEICRLRKKKKEKKDWEGTIRSSVRGLEGFQQPTALVEAQIWFCVGCFYVNLTQIRISREEGTSAEKIQPHNHSIRL